MGQTGDDNLLRKTLITTLAMMGASVIFVGGLSLIASSAAGHAVGAPAGASADTPAGAGASPVRAETVPVRSLNRRGRGGAPKAGESF